MRRHSVGILAAIIALSYLALSNAGLCSRLFAAAGRGADKSLPKIVLVDGESFLGRLVAITDQKTGESVAVFSLPDGGEKKVPLQDLWQIKFSSHKQIMNNPHRVIISFSNGGILSAHDVILKNGKVSFTSNLTGKTTADVSLIDTIYFLHSGGRARDVKDRVEQMGPLSPTEDYLVAENERGEWIPVPGVLKEIRSDRIVFRYGQADRTVGLDYVHMIRLARIARNKITPAGEIIGKDGSILPFHSLQFKQGKMAISCEKMQTELVRLGELAEIRFRSNRFVYLSDLTPVKVDQAGLFDITFPFRQDRSSAGGPLKLSGTIYKKGLGLHSRCSVTYELKEDFRLFVALAGIDDSTDGKGNAELRILADGKDIVKPIILTAGVKPIPLRCNIQGVKRLTILVDFGPDHLDVGDHVDLVEARLVRK